MKNLKKGEDDEQAPNPPHSPCRVVGCTAGCTILCAGAIRGKGKRPCTRRGGGLISHYRSEMFQNNANSTVNWEVYGVQDEVPFVTDLTVGYDVTDMYNLSVTVTNLFDSEYFLWNKAPGTAGFGMLTARF
ncbi:MAG: TonB-dependent receptor [Candidatus Electrothrix sp. AUS3]|nr:TonB-dependent receptor [Candidatus Electrothrix gigas]